jgi:hypothetical protein
MRRNDLMDVITAMLARVAREHGAEMWAEGPSVRS